MVKLLTELTTDAMAYKGHHNRTKGILWEIAERNREPFVGKNSAKEFVVSLITNNALEYKFEMFGGGIVFGHTKTNGDWVVYGLISYIPVL